MFHRVEVTSPWAVAKVLVASDGVRPPRPARGRNSSGNGTAESISSLDARHQGSSRASRARLDDTSTQCWPAAALVQPYFPQFGETRRQELRGAGRKPQ